MQATRILDENRPCLQWVTATTLIVSAHVPDTQENPVLTGPDNLLYVIMRDGRRFASAPLVLDATVVGEGGLSAAPAADDWYYVYLVPSLSDPSILAIIGSPNTPNNGPTGYRQWVYAGAARWDNANVTFAPFRYVGGGRFSYVAPVVALQVNAGDDAAPVAANLYGATLAIPDSVYEAEIIVGSELTLGGGTGIRLHVWAGVDAGITAPTWVEEVSVDLLDDTARYSFAALLPSRPTGTTPYVWYRREDLTANSTATLLVLVRSYVDMYLR